MVRFYYAFLILLLIVSTGYTQNGLDLDGIDDGASALNGSALVAGSSTITMTMWVYPRNPAAGWPNFDGFGGIRNELNADFYLLQLNSTQVEARFRNSSGTNYTFTFDSLQLNAWNHFVLMYDGTNLIGYHNGAFEKQISASGTFTSTTEPFNVGFVPFQSNPFYTDGQIDEVSLWSRTLSASEIECIYYSGINQPDSSLELYYKMDQGVAGGNNISITQLVDSAGNINAPISGMALTGTASNFVAGVPQYIDIQQGICNGDSVLFDGVYYFSQGIYRNVYAAANGCDSIRQLTLQVGNHYGATEFDTVCTGSDYTFPDGTLIQNVQSPTSHTSNMLTNFGCDSIVVTNLAVFTIPSTTVNDTICSGEDYTFPDGTTQQNITSSTMQTSTVSTGIGCDSVVVTDLFVVSLDTSVSFTPPATLTSNMNNAAYQWILCHVLNLPAVGEVNQSFTATNSGSFAVVVYQGGCEDTSECHDLTISAISDESASVFSLFPNPAEDHLVIELAKSGIHNRVIIVDVLGRKRLDIQLRKDRTALDISDFEPGVYYLDLIVDGNVLTRSFQVR